MDDLGVRGELAHQRHLEAQKRPPQPEEPPGAGTMIAVLITVVAVAAGLITFLVW